jgi:hypothetical protein
MRRLADAGNTRANVIEGVRAVGTDASPLSPFGSAYLCSNYVLSALETGSNHSTIVRRAYLCSEHVHSVIGSGSNHSTIVGSACPCRERLLSALGCSITLQCSAV